MKKRYLVTPICLLTVTASYFYFYGFIRKENHLQLGSDSDHKVLTSQFCEGRLGNQMFLFATLYGFGKLNNRRIAINLDNFNQLSPYFELNYPVVNISTIGSWYPWYIGYYLRPGDSSIPPTTNILAGNSYPTSFTFFDSVREEIRHIFRFRPSFQKHVDSVLRRVKQTRPWTEVFVCVHVRRGDYLGKNSNGWLKAFEGREVDITYFKKSIQYFNSKYRNVIFLAVSDDRTWTRENLSPLGILTLPEVESAGHDLALLSSCNHTIMTYGTFGFWGGFLAGGEVVYFTDFVNPNGKALGTFMYDKMYPEHWIGISTTPPDFWDNYTNPFMK